MCHLGRIACDEKYFSFWKHVLKESYLDSMTSEENETIIPNHEDIPKILNKVYANHEIVKIDHHIPGCPPDSSHIWNVVKNILFQEEYSIAYPKYKYD